MSKKDKKNKNGKKKGGMGKLMMTGVVILGAGAGAFWYLAPDTFQASVQRLTSMLGN